MSRWEVDVTWTLAFHMVVDADTADEARAAATDRVQEIASNPDRSDLTVVVERGVS